MNRVIDCVDFYEQFLQLTCDLKFLIDVPWGLINLSIYILVSIRDKDQV